MDRHEDMPRSGFEFVVNEPEKLARFYQGVFGYDVLIQVPDTGEWTVNIRRPDASGNMIEESKPVRKSHHVDSPYIGNFHVDNVQEKLELVIIGDGRLFLEADENDPVKDMIWGKQVYCCDPENNMFGMVEYINNRAVRGVES
jgi:predicted enzyme related to lactoylglutathione lyase